MSVDWRESRPEALVGVPGGRGGGRTRLPDRFEVDGIRLLADARPAALLDVLDAGDRHDLVADLLRADANMRQGLADATDLHALVERVHDAVPLPLPAEGADAARLRAWAHAILVEQLFADRQPEAVSVAKGALDELEALPAPLVPSVALRYAHARLLRIAAGGWLIVPAAGALDRYLALRDDAITSLLLCGFADEVHVTRGVGAGLIATILCEDIREQHECLTDARAALGDGQSSMWTAILDYFLANTCFEVGDIPGALQALDRLEQCPYQHPFLEVAHRYGRAFFRLVTAGASRDSVAGIDRALADARSADPQVAQFWYWHVAHTLADLGSRAAARFARLEAELPALPIRGPAERRLLQRRIAALAGEPVSTDETLTELDSLLGTGLGRRAARTAVRLGHDLVAGGEPDAARVIHGWGVDHLPPPGRRTVWEDWWCRPIDEPAPAPRLIRTSDRAAGRSHERPAPVQVRVLTPTVEVEIDGRAVPLSLRQSKLVLLLVMAHPSPLHVEQVSDALWPDEDLAVTRPRLNSLLLRTRRALGRDTDVIIRSGDLLRLEPAPVQVDLWRYQRGLKGDGDQRRAALASVQGNLGHAQFPYDEELVEARHRLVAEWLGHAERSRRAGEVGVAELAPALESLGLSPTDLGSS